jgi:hypothetical protein
VKQGRPCAITRFQGGLSWNINIIYGQLDIFGVVVALRDANGYRRLASALIRSSHSEIRLVSESTT